MSSTKADKSRKLKALVRSLYTVGARWRIEPQNRMVVSVPPISSYVYWCSLLPSWASGV